MIKKHKKLFMGIIIILVAILAGRFYFLGDNSNYKFKDIESISKLTKEDYIEDFEYAYDTLKNYYPFFEVNKEINGIDWIENYSKYKDKIENLSSDNEFYNIMDEILNDLNNGHTNMIPLDGGVVSGVSFAYSYSYFPRLDWRSDIFNLFKDKNVQARYNITNETMQKYKDEQNKEYDTREEENLSIGLLNGNVAYIGIKGMATPDEASEKFLKDKDNLEDFLLKNKNSKVLVIDIRDNGGGNSMYWSDFILPMILDKGYSSFEYSFFKEGDLLKKVISNYGAKDIDYDDIKDFPKETLGIVENFDKYSKYETTIGPNEESINFKGKVYLLVNEKVYSSSEKLAVFAKESNLAILVGERTGGDGIGTDPMVIALPNTGYLLRFPKQLGVTGKGSINEKDKTLPDYKVENSNKKLKINDGKVEINGDEVLKKVLELEEN